MKKASLKIARNTLSLAMGLIIAMAPAMVVAEEGGSVGLTPGANTGATDVRYHVGSHFLVEVPPYMHFASIGSTIEETVTASDVSLSDGQFLLVTMKPSAGALVRGAHSIPYSVETDHIDKVVAETESYKVLVATEGVASQTNKFWLSTKAEDKPTVAGEYTDTLTFVATVNDKVTSIANTRWHIDAKLRNVEWMVAEGASFNGTASLNDNEWSSHMFVSRTYNVEGEVYDDIYLSGHFADSYCIDYIDGMGMFFYDQYSLGTIDELMEFFTTGNLTWDQVAIVTNESNRIHGFDLRINSMAVPSLESKMIDWLYQNAVINTDR